jgi:hypothetical protein
MRRNLWLLDLTLFIAVVVAGFVLRQKWAESARREEALLRQLVPAGPPSALPNIPVVTPTTPSSYLEVAQMMLFSRDRKPDVILDPPPPPPPPPQMPPLPVAYGMMDLGLGPMAILAEKAGAPHHSYKAGDTIGAFKIVAMNTREILFDWEGQPIKKTLEELAEKKSTVAYNTPPQDGNQPASAPPPAQQTTAIGGTKGPVADTDMGNQTKACAAGDTSPAGTVESGMRKVVTKSPFGDVCRWEPVR